MVLKSLWPPHWFFKIISLLPCWGEGEPSSLRHRFPIYVTLCLLPLSTEALLMLCLPSYAPPRFNVLRVCAQSEEGQGERESQARCQCRAGTWGPNPWTMRSWPKLKSRVSRLNQLSRPGTPLPLFLKFIKEWGTISLSHSHILELFSIVFSL